jgi:hypothetical protein
MTGRTRHRKRSLFKIERTTRSKIWQLDFLYLGALMGKRYQNVPREAAYRNALERMRDAAGDAYILACGAPIMSSLGLCDVENDKELADCY